MLKKVVIAAALLTLLNQGVTLAGSLPADSVGMEKRNGKNFVVHKVIPKETLFALSRKYNVPVNQIVDANPNLQNGLMVGQIVYVPSKVPVRTPEPVLPVAKANTAPSTPYTYVIDAKGNKVHQVVSKQTLYSIARMYNITMADIRKWNNLTSDNLTVGDDLIVGMGNKPTPNNNPQYVGEVDDTIDKNKTPAANKTPVKTAEVINKSSEPARPAEPVKTAEPVVRRDTEETTDHEENTAGVNESVSKITESGLAEVIEGNSNNNKYLALHKSAPVGSILQVKNIMNGQSVYVRVIGKLPETGNNDKVVVKISKRAFQRLASLDNRFRVEVSYMP